MAPYPVPGQDTERFVRLFAAGRGEVPRYIPYRWHHLVAQRAGGRMELYLDGAPAPPVRLGPEVATEACRLLLGRLKPEPRRPGRVHSRPFVGRIDELALYNRPLSAAEVRRHYGLVASGGRPPGPEADWERP